MIVLEEGMGTWSYRDQENNDWLWLVWEFLAGRRRKLADLGVFKRGGGEIGGPEENKKKWTPDRRNKSDGIEKWISGNTKDDRIEDPVVFFFFFKKK